MQRITPVLSLLLFFSFLTAGSFVIPLENTTVFPTPFTDLMHARYEGDFYDNQAEGWKQVATGECATDEDWFHYYKTALYSNRFGSGTYDLPAILAAAELVMSPHDFDLPYLRFAANNHPTERWDDLLVAHANDPNRHEAYPALATYYETRGEIMSRNTVLKELHLADPLPAGVMEYNYNQLMSVGANGILLTNGDTDTYPSWILQSAYNVRQDVRVASIPLLQGYPELRKRFLAEFGMNDPFPAEGPPPSVPELMELLAGQSMPVYLAATGRDYLNDLPKEKLYLSGLAFYYGNFPIDNLEILAGNFESGFRTENLRQPLTNGPVQAVADQLNQNYLPALLELYAYNEANPSPRFQPILALIEPLAARAGRSAELAAYLRGGPAKNLASSASGIVAKEIDKNYHQLRQPWKETKYRKHLRHPDFTDLKMGVTEISNADYQLFLEDLLRQHRFDLLDSVAIAPLDPADIEPVSLRENAENHFSGGKHELLGGYPIVNIPHHAAELYAAWLTEAYNADPKRKEEREVRFRLPTKEEFIYAARGGREHAPYPWGGPYFRNIRGCLLANFNTYLPESKADFDAYAERVRSNPKMKAKDKAEVLEKINCDYEDDGGVLTVAVNSYYPNDYGLYNMSGNAAEMTATEGETMGGSWLDGSHYMQIEVVKQRSLPHPSTGFRLVMEFVE